MDSSAIIVAAVSGILALVGTIYVAKGTRKTADLAASVAKLDKEAGLAKAEAEGWKTLIETTTQQYQFSQAEVLSLRKEHAIAMAKMETLFSECEKGRIRLTAELIQLREQLNAEIVSALKDIPVQAKKQALVVAKELKKVGDQTAKKLSEVGSQTVNEQHVDHQHVSSVQKDKK